MRRHDVAVHNQSRRVGSCRGSIVTACAAEEICRVLRRVLDDLRAYRDDAFSGK
jgi:hypothetical protein